MTAKKADSKSVKEKTKVAAKKEPSKKSAEAKKASAKKEPAAKAAAPKKAKASKATLVSPKGEAAFKQIEQEAYYIAERDGFRCDPLEYWCEAEVRLGMRKA